MNRLDFVEIRLNFSILAFETRYHIVCLCQKLRAVLILGGLLPLLFQIGYHRLLVLGVRHGLLEILLQLRRLILLISILDPFVGDGLLLVKDFVRDRLFVLFPLLTQFFQISCYLPHLSLEHVKVLALQLFDFA